MNTDGFSRMRVIHAFRHAVRGVGFMTRTQPNARIHAVATALVLLTATLLRISATEWVALILACTLVWVAEAFNTALEFLADALHPTFNGGVGQAKDVAAGAVLIATLGATCVGLWIFVPHFLRAL